MLVLAHPAATATRQKMTGKSLLVLCEHRDDLIYTACLTYIAGATDLAEMLHKAWPEDFPAIICRSPGTNKQLADSVTAHLRRHPEQQDLLAIAAVLSVLVDAQTCSLHRPGMS